MGLTARQLRSLESMEERLRAREPRLASMFAMFTRLTQDEAIPATGAPHGLCTATAIHYSASQIAFPRPGCASRPLQTHHQQ